MCKYHHMLTRMCLTELIVTAYDFLLSFIYFSYNTHANLKLVWCGVFMCACAQACAGFLKLGKKELSENLWPNLMDKHTMPKPTTEQTNNIYKVSDEEFKRAVLRKLNDRKKNNTETCQYSRKLKRWKQLRIGKEKLLSCKIQLKKLKNRNRASIAAHLKQKEELLELEDILFSHIQRIGFDCMLRSHW